MRKTRTITFSHLKDSKTGKAITLEVPDDDIARRHIDAAMRDARSAADLAVADLKRMFGEGNG